jgi:DNA polymerase III subunit beta
MLSCLATDLEIQITAASRVDGTLPDFATTVAARKLLDICRSLPERTRLTLTHRTAARWKSCRIRKPARVP